MWEPGNSSLVLELALVQYMQKWTKEAPYVSRLPKQHVHVVRRGDKQPAGVNILVVSARDTNQSWIYTPSTGEFVGQPIMEEFHNIAIIAKADLRSGGVDSVETTAGVLKSLFSCPSNTDERDELISMGVFNLFESEAGITAFPGGVDDEGSFFSQALTLVCNTETIVR